MRKHSRHLLALAVTALLAACGGGDGDGSAGNPPAAVSAPAITTAPVSSTVNAGGTVTLSVVASGDGVLSYQWKRDGVDIAGATAASYSTPVLAVGDSGRAYTVVVSNAGGQSTSTAAVLTVNAAPATVVALTQASADQLVAEVNAGVSALRQADTVAALPFGAQTVSLPLGATVNQTIDCSTLGGGSGSGNISFALTTNDATGQPVSSLFNYNNCSFAMAGYSSSINGTGSMTFTNWTSETNFSFRLTYDLTYSVTSGSYSDSGTVRSEQTCTVNGELEDCSYRFGNDQVRDVAITNNGAITTVDRGRITNSNIDCVYDGWVFDGNAGRATSGTVTVTAPNGDRAVITATSTGYTVVITVGGNTSTFSVAFAS